MSTRWTYAFRSAAGWVVCFLILGWLAAGPVAAGERSHPFKVPKGLEPAVGFWKKVYTEYTTRHAILHDADDLSVIYEVVYLGEKPLSYRQRRRKVNPIRRKYQKILRKLSSRRGTLGLNAEERRVARLVKGSYSRAARNIRVQLGQKDRFREGLIRSGRYMDGIRRAFRLQGVPEELTVLPHVESSFQVNAYSSAGAAGVWQFTRRTGRRFMKIGYEVDERRDPILSAHAAAKLLRYNYEELQSWPLAITAYNHGVNGMKRAKRKYGDDIVRIIKRYKSRTFGFASRNFYAEFLAALEVVNHYQRYFPNLKPDPPLQTTSVRLSSYIHIDDLIRTLNLSREEIARYNPALREPVISGKKRIPKHFLFQAPKHKVDNLARQVASIPDKYKYDSQVRSRWYTVQRGDTLSTIARRMGTTVRALRVFNNIDNKHRIYRGQVLEMPWGAGKGSPRVRVASAPPSRVRDFSPGQLQTYRVRPKDNLSKIARRFEMSVAELVRVNRLRHPDRLYPGQRLRVASPVEVARADETTRSRAGKKSQKPFKLQVKKAVAKDKEVVASVASVEERPGKGKIKIEFSDSLSNAVHFNKNRPAFMPVKFSGASHKNGRVGLITVDFEETLSHYAEWAKLSVRELRRFNKLSRRAHLKINQVIKIPFYKTRPEEFEQKRQEYHKAIQEDFFNNFRVEKVVIRNLKKGETLWEICNDVYVIPMWLLSNYNQDKDLNSLAAGESINIPVITAIKA